MENENQNDNPNAQRNAESNDDLSSSFSTLKNYFENQTCCIEGLQPLKEGVEIGIILRKSLAQKAGEGTSLEAALLKRKGRPYVERRPAQKPDVYFEMSAQAVLKVAEYTGPDVGQFGIRVVQQVLAGEVKIRVVGKILSLMMNGYLGIIKAGGVEFTKILAQNGFSNLTKFPELIKKMRN